MVVTARPTVKASPARAKMAELLPQAKREGWTAKQMAEMAGVSYDSAARYLSYHRQISIYSAEQSTVTAASRLASEAQEARAHALEQLQTLRDITKTAADRVKRMAWDEHGNAVLVDPVEYGKAVKSAVSASKELLSYTEQVCGIDVVKAITVRTQTAKDGPLVSWDGVESLTKAIEMDIVQDVDTMMQHAPALPAPSHTESGGISLDHGWD